METKSTLVIIAFVAALGLVLPVFAEPDDEQVQKICAKEKNPHCKAVDGSGVGTDGRSYQWNHNVNTDNDIPPLS